MRSSAGCNHKQYESEHQLKVQKEQQACNGLFNAKVHDVNILDIIPYETVVDKGYIDFLRLHKIHTQGSFFVTRAKDNMRFKRMYSRKVIKQPEF